MLFGIEPGDAAADFFGRAGEPESAGAERIAGSIGATEDDHEFSLTLQDGVHGTGIASVAEAIIPEVEA